MDTGLRGPEVASVIDFPARFRRARHLIGQAIALPGSNGGATIYDLHFEPVTGLITQVIVSTADGRLAYPPDVLRHGAFPPATRLQP